MYNSEDLNKRTIQEYVSEGTQRAIVAVAMEGSEVNLYQLDNGDYIDTIMAVNLVESGLLPGYSVGTSVGGEYYIRSFPDGDPTNNLTNLPRF